MKREITPADQKPKQRQFSPQDWPAGVFDSRGGSDRLDGAGPRLWPRCAAGALSRSRHRPRSTIALPNISWANTPIQRLYHSQKMLWAEGPAWNGVGRYLLWSDIPNNVQMRWLEEDGHVTTFRHPSGNSNGNTFDYQGRQIACEHGNRRVVRYEYNGKITVLADSWQGKPFNAPNDAVVHPNDGAVWFTDPGYGSLMNYEGQQGPARNQRSGLPSRRASRASSTR